MGTLWLEGEHVRKEPRERSEMLALMGFPSNVQLVGVQSIGAGIGKRQ
jgi:hypothetical protein